MEFTFRFLQLGFFFHGKETIKIYSFWFPAFSIFCCFVCLFPMIPSIFVWIYLSILLLMDISVVSSLTPVRIKLCTCLGCIVAHMSAFLEIKSLGCRLYEYTALTDNVKQLSEVFVPLYISVNSKWEFHLLYILTHDLFKNSHSFHV